VARKTLGARLRANPHLLRAAAAGREAYARLAMTPELRAWRRDGADRLRYEYDLGPESIVVDAGGYEGQWTSDIVAMYGCRVHVFEPMPAYAERIERRFARNPLVTVHAEGLAPADGSARLSLSGDASSHALAADGDGASVEIRLRGVEGFFAELGDGARVDLMKLNIEGAEYDLIERLIDSGLIERVVDLQVQFHDYFPDARERMLGLRERLARTHRQTYSYDFLWENWRLRD
jgi:FkbM family methyltransferase